MDIADINAVMTGNRELTVENYKGLLEYREDCVLVLGKYRKLLITGQSLVIDYYTQFDLHVRGKIESLQWLG